MHNIGHKISHIKFLLQICLVIAAVVLPTMVVAQATAKDKFVVVLDAGHGGNDAGAIGVKGKEKNINLGVVLK